MAGSYVVSAAATLVLAVAGPPALSAVGALALGLASGIPFAASLGAAARVRPGRACRRHRDGEHGGEPAHRRRHAARRSHVHLPGDGRIGFLLAVGVLLAAMLAVPAVRSLAPAPAPRV